MVETDQFLVDCDSTSAGTLYRCLEQLEQMSEQGGRLSTLLAGATKISNCGIPSVKDDLILLLKDLAYTDDAWIEFLFNWSDDEQRACDRPSIVNALAEILIPAGVFESAIIRLGAKITDDERDAFAMIVNVLDEVEIHLLPQVEMAIEQGSVVEAQGAIRVLDVLKYRDWIWPDMIALAIRSSHPFVRDFALDAKKRGLDR